MKTKEERFLGLLKDYRVEFSTENFINFNISNSDGRLMVLYNKNCLDTSYAGMDYIFEEEYKMNKQEIKKFIGDMMLKHFKLKNLVIRDMK